MTRRINVPDYLPRLLALAIPIAAQALLVTLLNLSDTLMIGQLGEVAIASIALGNQIFFVLMLFLFGTGSGGAIFAAQFWGRKDVAGVRHSLGLTLVISCIGALVFTAFAVMIPEQVLSVFSTDSAVIAGASSYLRIVAWGYLPMAITVSFAHGLRSVGDTRTPLLASVISIGVNVVGNYLLIFGAFGFPALGVRGAAIATALARWLELAIILARIYTRRGPTAASLRELFGFSRAFARRFLGRALPVVFNEILWSTGFTMYTVVFGRMGTSYLAAYNISDTLARLMLVLFIGTGQASQVLIGNMIGEGEIERARDVGRSILAVAAVAAVAVGALTILVVAPFAPRLFALDEQTRAILATFLRMFGILLIAKVVNIHAIVGVLRGGGDTRYALLIDIIPLWAIGVSAAFVVGLVLKQPAWVVYLALNVEELVRLALVIHRVRGTRWIHDLVDGPSLPPADAPAAGAVPSTRSHP